MNEYPRTFIYSQRINKVFGYCTGTSWPWNLLPIVLAGNDRLAAPSAPTSFVPLWAPSAPCCKKCSLPSLRIRPSDAKLVVPDCVYTEGGHRRKWTTARAANKSTPALPRIFVSTSNASVRPSRSVAHLPRVKRIAGPSSTPRTSQVYNWPLIIAVAPFLEGLGYGTACPLSHALIPRIGLYHHPSFERAT
ncbi:hypothetical protein B0H16DRAFT_1575855 [Mycena metata]|uniref:Uncharacterized protein n=1 Tax=Mycena metata TaxID=1033252 RepID=A0AAD7I5E3_9AGAR|nr:hypothetical protein B0H16DRAFT_1575855 [Mycena metata]